MGQIGSSLDRIGTKFEPNLGQIRPKQSILEEICKKHKPIILLSTTQQSVLNSESNIFFTIFCLFFPSLKFLIKVKMDKKYKYDWLFILQKTNNL
jgi:hypothetical protein